MVETSEAEQTLEDITVPSEDVQEDDKYEHTANNLTGVLDTYIEEGHKEVTVIYGETTKKYTGESIDIDLSEIEMDNIDEIKMEILLQYHVVESDNVEPADRYVQVGDYFYVNIPKYMRPHFEEGNKLIDVKERAEFAVSKVQIYQDGKAIDGVDFEDKEGSVKLHLSPEVVSNHTVVANVQMKDNSDEYAELVCTDDSDVRLTQKKLEKKYEKQYIDVFDKETYVDYSIIINSAGVMLGDVELIDTISSRSKNRR